MEHLPADQAHSVRNRCDAAPAERCRVDDAQQLVAECDVALECGVQSAVGGVGICSRLSSRMTAMWLAETSLLVSVSGRLNR